MATDLVTAIEDFRRARNQASLREILALLRGESNQLLSYDEVKEKLKLQGSSEKGLRDIPLNAIVGSVGRYTDFTRDFLPRGNVDEDRWARVRVAASGMIGLPPIDVYQIGDLYFVQDGNHRVSVARRLGAKFIQARVTEVQTRVPLSPDDRPDDLIVKAEYADFLTQTHLDELRPEANVMLIVPGGYTRLCEHIEIHQYFMGLDFQRDVTDEEAVTHWYDNVYMPVVQAIRALGIMRYFPNQTETDLYLWAGEHSAGLEKLLGWQVKPEAAAADLVSQYAPRSTRLIGFLGEKLRDVAVPQSLEPGPPTGQWRQERLAVRNDDRLFSELLVPINGRPDGWCALDQALVIAGRDGAGLHGLYVVAREDEIEGDTTQALRSEFIQRCAQAGVAGELTIAAGEVTREICSRARWTDLVVVKLTYPPGEAPLERLSSGFRTLVQRCPRPLLAVPGKATGLSHGLLAYDGSPKAEEALFVGTYLAGQWGNPLKVATVLNNGNINAETLDRARRYLEEHHVQASYEELHGPPGQELLQAAEKSGCDFILMGGYGYQPVLEVMLGSVVDQVLRESHKPVFICR